VLGASAQSAFTCLGGGDCGPNTRFNDVSFGFATFTDEFTLSPGQTLIGFCPTISCTAPGSGDAGYFNLSFTVAGSASGVNSTKTFGGGAARFEIGVTFGPGSNTFIGVCTAPLTAGASFTCPFNIPFNYDAQFSITAGLAAVASTGVFGTNAMTDANFYDTATLTGIQVFDNSGAQWGGFTIASGSGTQYGENGVVVGSAGGSSGMRGPDHCKPAASHRTAADWYQPASAGTATKR
jgi:hypothetical protein